MKKELIPSPTLFVIDSNIEVCATLRWLFEPVKISIETFNSVSAFLKTYSRTRSGCILADIDPPEMNGLKLLAELKSRKNRLPVIIMACSADTSIVVKAMQFGATDFILKPFNPQCLISQVQKHFLQQPLLDGLTKRENQVMDLIIAGKLNKQIALELGISISTVELHRANLKKKMGIKTFGQLIKF